MLCKCIVTAQYAGIVCLIGANKTMLNGGLRSHWLKTCVKCGLLADRFSWPANIHRRSQHKDHKVASKKTEGGGWRRRKKTEILKMCLFALKSSFSTITQVSGRFSLPLKWHEWNCNYKRDTSWKHLIKKISYINKRFCKFWFFFFQAVPKSYFSCFL